MLLDLGAALQRAVEPPGVRAVIVAAAGPVFSSGHDFGDMIERDLDGMRRLLSVCTELMLGLARLPVPVVACVQGIATAAGCQLVASCDLAVAVDEATFATPGGRGGWFCHTPMVAVARAIGARRALELGMTGDSIDARTALAWGLVNRVCPRADLIAETHKLARAASRGSLASKAASSLGLRGGNLLARSVGKGVGLDEAQIETKGDLKEASFVAGKYLSPNLYVSYGIGLFDPVSTLRLRYVLSSKWTLQAETGTGTGADLLYRFESGR